MNELVYEESVRRELRIWQRQMGQSPTWTNRLAKRLQQKINNIIPEKIHQAITGAGGILLGLADFPLLLGIKLKMLHDIAALYGHFVTDYRERIYLLYIF
ncbi:Protein EcsC [Adhaeribacter pallidiroseus]|uniref:Protein EcsC n=1 Tax=Adhaeribacter pallidiroseus TaxID=2072847 RepID=A0A369QT04_9BACT|nr:Protein EcsC [Adhaeribacter pallidiroseus]